ncbi:MAG: hypothetical protein V4658_07880 [Bacteroidota bacterium]
MKNDLTYFLPVYSCRLAFCFLFFLVPLVSFSQINSIFHLNQKTFIETHHEFPYHDHEAVKRDSVKTFTSYVYRFTEKGTDTLEKSYMVFDQEGKVVEVVEEPIPGGQYGYGEHVTTYYYDKKGNDTLVKRAIHSPSYEWLLCKEYEARATTSEEKKAVIALRKKLKAEGRDKTEINTEDELAFTYDNNGYPVYFTNRAVGYKCVIDYTLNAKGLVEEIFSVDTNQELFSRINQYSRFLYDNKNRLIHMVKKGTPLKENKHDEPWESITDLEYDTSGQYSRVIHSVVKDGQVRDRDTTNYYYLYNAKKELEKEITAMGTDTITVLNHTYENGLEKMMISRFYQSGHSFAPGNTSKEVYTYDDNGKLKTTAYYTMRPAETADGEQDIEWIEKVESCYYTYH